MQRLSTLLLTFLFLAFLNSVTAQQSFVQSRFVGSEEESCPVGECSAEDGILHFRLQPVGTLGNEVFRDSGGDEAMRFEVQVRVANGNVTYNSGSVFIEHGVGGVIIFGSNASNFCKVSDAGIFRGKSYTHSLQDESTQILKLSILNETDKTVVLNTEYQTYAVLECKIAHQEGHSRLALHAKTYNANSIWTTDGSTTKTAFALADNDLRGLRLDGKTWVRDYIPRDDNGIAVIRFTRGIKTRLTEQHFRVDNGNMLDVIHTPGSDDAILIFDQSNHRNYGRVSFTTGIVDENNIALVQNGFVADLQYDGGAPRVISSTRTTTVGTLSKWLITMNKPLHPTSVRAENMCLVEVQRSYEQGYDCLGSDDEIPVIQSVLIGSDTDHTTFTVVIDHKIEGAQRSDIELRFKRNAVLGADLKVVEGIPSAALSSDTMTPQITIEAIPRIPYEFGVERYEVIFKVSSDEAVWGLGDINAYKLRRIRAHDNEYSLIFPFPPTASILASGSTEATVRFELNMSREEREKTVGFTLVYGGYDQATQRERIRDVSGNNTPVTETILTVTSVGADELPRTTITEQLFDSRRAAIARFKALECASIYPYIGRHELFLHLHYYPVNTAAFTVGGEAIAASAVSQIGTTSDDRVSALKIELGEEIIVAPLTVEYRPDPDTVVTTMCERDVDSDADGDGTEDLVDIEPFNADENGINTEIAQAGPLSSPPTFSNVYYSRSVIIPALLRAEQFTYITVENGVPIKQQFTKDMTLTPAEYFGITDSNARLFRDKVKDGLMTNECSAVLLGFVNSQGAIKYSLTKMRITELCEEVTDDMSNEPKDFINYVWAKVTNEGYTASRVIRYDAMRVMDEINFLGQSSYLHAVPTTQTVTIASYVNRFVNPVAAKIDYLSAGSIQSDSVPLSIDSSLATASYVITNPNPGETITYWLDGIPSNRNHAGVWHPNMGITPIVGGRDNSDGRSAVASLLHSIGADNHIDIKIAAVDEAVVRMQQIQLYDQLSAASFGQVQQALSVVSGRTYYAVADFTANLRDLEIMPNVILADDDYEIHTTETATAILDTITSGLVGNQYDIITFTVNDTNTTGTITVGWQQIGNLRDIETNFMLKTSLSFTDSDFIILDQDNDRIDIGSEFPGFEQDNDNQKLYIPDLRIEQDPQYSYLRTDSSQPLYISDPGLMIGLTNDSIRTSYFPANIRYSELSDEIKELLGYTETDFDTQISTPIESIATYGVREVAYAVAADGRTIGGVTRAVFPVRSTAIGETLYLSKYNKAEDRWENFRRGGVMGYVDTWYAIERPYESVGGFLRYQPCPTNSEIYKAKHRAAANGAPGFVAAAENCIMSVITDGGPYDGYGLDGRVSDTLAIGRQFFVGDQHLECASFYPNIGQQEIFLRLTSNFPIDLATLTLTQNGNPLAIAATQVVETVDADVSILKATLMSEIENGTNIIASYTPSANHQAVVVCTADISRESGDTDGDGVLDIVDSAPFDATVTTVSTDPVTRITAPTPLLSAPQKLDTYYSRDTLVRSLIRGAEFTYIEEIDGVPVERTFTRAMALSAAQYFGVESANAKILNVPPTSQCQLILDTARANHLNKVKIDEFCTDVTNQLANQPVATHRYAWVRVANGVLTSDYEIYPAVRVLSEVSFSGQSSYLYAGPTTKSIVVTADVGVANHRQIKILRSDQTQPVTVTLNNVNSTRAEGIYYLASSDAHPPPGETVSHRFDGASVWNPASTNLQPQADGHNLSSIMYATAAGNYVQYRVVDDIIRVQALQLYELSQSARRVRSVVSGRSYALRVYYKASMPNIEVVESPLHEGYTVDDTLVVNITTALDDEGYRYEQITFVVGDDTRGAITVGWDTIGSANNIKATYHVSNSEPVDYAAIDNDMNGIPDNLQMGNNLMLQVAIGSGALRTVDALRTDGEGRELFASDSGLIIALSKGATVQADYSAANIKYSELSDDTKAMLGFTEIGMTTDTAIETIATFGIRGVEYTIGEDQETAEGGVTYTTFPIQSSQVDQTLYLNKYNSDALPGAPSWRPFERGTVEGYVDTWYAIERPDNNLQCPTDIVTYRDGHRAVGDENLGFIASAQNCIMLVITDGGPYDDSGIDGRVVDPLAIGRQFFNAGIPMIPTMPTDNDGSASGGGSGAVDYAEILFLIVTLGLLLVTVYCRRRGFPVTDTKGKPA